MKPHEVKGLIRLYIGIMEGETQKDLRGLHSNKEDTIVRLSQMEKINKQKSRLIPITVSE